MRTLTFLCLLLLLIAGCISSRTSEDSFGSLHGLVKQTLAGSCVCGPIITNEVVGGRYFEVSPQPRGLRITVSERQFLSQKEWERRYASSTNLISQFMEFARTNHPADTNHPIDVKTAERFIGITNAFGLFELPEWSYHSIGVDVSVQEIDVVYPGCDQDDAEAQKRYKEVIRLLKPYHRANNGAAANRRYAGQLDDFMKFDCQDCIWESRSAAVAELKR
jgi:hypothetical protein